MILALIVLYASFYAILALLGSSVEAFVVNRPSTKTSGFSRLKMGTKPGPSSAEEEETKDSARSRRDLWKEIGSLERQAVDVLTNSAGDSAESRKEAFKLLSKSVGLKKSDTFLLLANQYVDASEMKGDAKDADDILEEMYKIGLPPHIKYIVSQRRIESGIDRVNSSNSKDNEISSTASDADGSNEPTGSTEKKKGADLIVLEEIDEESTFSEQVTEKIRIRVQSFYDDKESDPANGQYMFRYKVAVFNEGPEAVQIVARMWELERYPTLEKEVLRGTGLLQNQPIISPGDVYAYESRCPIKLFPPKGKRVLASMQGAYTMCRGNMGQHNFPVKIEKFNLIIPEVTAGGTQPSPRYKQRKNGS